MKTIKAIKLLLEEYKQHVERIVARSKTDYDKQVKVAQAETMGKLKKLSMLFPDLMPADNESNMSEKDMEIMLANLKRRVEMKYSARLLPSVETLRDEIYGTEFNTPAFIEWQGATSKEANFVIDYDKSNVKDAISAMNYLVGNMLLSLPIKRVHLNFVDLNFTGAAQLFTKNLDKSLYRDLIVDTQQLNYFCKEMQQRMVTVLQECGNLVEYNEQNKTYRYPYEIVVLLDYPNMYEYVAQQLAALFENGHKGGIYFVVLHNTDIKPSNQNKSLIDMKDHYSVLNLKNLKAANTLSLLENKSLSEYVFNYINEEATRKPKARVVKADYEEMYERPYLDVVNCTLEIPVGVDENDKPAHIFINTYANHFGSLIIGGSGSGKSTFLKSFIANAMLTYSPQDLQFYLLDFKGVELSIFKESKHVRTLLTNGNDLDMTLEIFRDLKKEYERRNFDLFTKMGCNDLASYNRLCPKEKRLPHIIMAADECQDLFSTSNNYTNAKKGRELTTILETLARKGRSTGIHMVFATQSLVGTEFPKVIETLLPDRYLLKCSENDSNRLIEGSATITSNLEPGKVYTRSEQQDRLFQSYHFDIVEEWRKINEYIIGKAKDYNGESPILINGSQVFPLDDELINNLPAKRNNVAALGCSIDLQREPVQISLKADDGENILFFGINDQEQVTRTVMSALTTLMYTAKNNGRQLHAYVIDSLGLDDGKYLDVLDKLQQEMSMTIIKKRDVGTELHRIATSIINDNAEPSLLVILGQERMRDLRLNNDIEIDDTAPVENDASNFGMDLSSFDFGGDSGGKNKKADISSYRKALAYILDNGPRLGVNTLLQVDMPSKVLYDDYVNAKFIFGKFNHLVMFRSEEKAATPLGLSDDIHLDQLPAEEERTRAIYYASDRDVYQMFVPYVIK